MGYTLEDYDALNKALASGAKKVQYADKSIEYQSVGDMLRIREEMKNELGLNTRSSKVLASVSKGL